ncbi:ABC transporter permease [Streptomyces antarcticus]|uniref:ABC transporter permease n=1 Tax=Streptomyces antarcticus TaxID=2996458 RepID=UPI0022705308|nr:MULTISPECIES: ABC transporter permease [unclassified Streptomyces]MCY0940067.1 ABC transporter permease [Streptomyces sp. H34-AA3]MCY0948256.1 ABC transporter permease [Streptomyces sp. H27-S2]MCZ4083731.1 ABC transporter permease [Streptomyces sp. H34-S5]
MSSFPGILNSEWTKIRTVASTTWTLASALVVTVGSSAALCAVVSATLDDMTPQERLTFDPTMASFVGMTFGQLAMIVFGVLVVGTEYSSGMIRTSLAAVPRRVSFFFGKLTVATALALVVGLATSFLSFFLGQVILGDASVGIGGDNVLRAVIGGGLYMAMIALFSMGVAAILRGSVLAICMLIPFFLVISNILGGVPATRKWAQYLPDQAGAKIMQVVPGGMDGSTTTYGPWGGFGIMVLWTAAVVLGGYLVLKKRDA